MATGAGHTAFLLAGTGFCVTASDLTPAMLERVREGAAERGLEIRTRQHSAEALPYPDGTFDPGDLPRGAASFFLAGRFRPRERPGAEAGRLARGHRWHGAGRFPGAEEWLAPGGKTSRPEPQPADPATRVALALRAERTGGRETRGGFRKQPDLEWYFETAATSAGKPGKSPCAGRRAPPHRSASSTGLARKRARPSGGGPCSPLVARKRNPASRLIVRLPLLRPSAA